ncbi:hypothetical protein TRFO_22173 [Tritrichomonas foetus]|uniref:DUF3447 domain-containing protein n=1 Tax=Tritrichomonas foetus TaxID=1144522 RepID=A0A1J4KC78_9EUKA|nr:hypothetical protein TRFO_22173 [Tritrichomonas foetus]|eukprot:OHT09025.1 hypothetical protein TRFO_22173 [Tritrichomonas foetus]
MFIYQIKDKSLLEVNTNQVSNVTIHGFSSQMNIELANKIKLYENSFHIQHHEVIEKLLNGDIVSISPDNMIFLKIVGEFYHLEELIQMIRKYEDLIYDYFADSPEIQYLIELQDILSNLNDYNVNETSNKCIPLMEKISSESFSSAILHVCLSNKTINYKTIFMLVRELNIVNDIILDKFLQISILKIELMFDSYSSYQWDFQEELECFTRCLFEEHLLTIDNFSKRINFSPRMIDLVPGNLIRYISNKKKIDKSDFNFDLHTKMLNENKHSNEILEFIRNDDLENFQKIIVLSNEDLNQLIPMSFYQRDTIFKNGHYNFIEYAAFYGAVKCFKFLLKNMAPISHKKKDNLLGKCAIAGGNFEIIHLCQQEKSSFLCCLEYAIKYHKNDVAEWLIDNNYDEILLKHSTDLCIRHYNIRVLLSIIKKGIVVSSGAYTAIESSNEILFSTYYNCFTLNHIENSFLDFNHLHLAFYEGNLKVIDFIIRLTNYDINAIQGTVGYYI